MVEKFFKIIFKISIVSSLIFCFFTPVYALTEYTELVELPGTTITGPCPAGGCTANIQTYLPGVFKLAIGLSAVLAFVMITYGGILYATSDAINNKEEGKEYIYNAVKGLILVIGAWAILYTINPKTLEFNLTLPVPKLASSTPSVTSGGAGGGNRLPGYNLTPAQVAQDKTIRDELWNSTSPKGQISVNTIGPCQNGEVRGCTNLVGLPSTAISGLKQLNSACNCQIIITGGAEGGHVTHGPGQPNVDTGVTQALTDYVIRNGGTPVQTTIGPRYTVTIGGKATTFLRESNPPHWHVVF